MPLYENAAALIRANLEQLVAGQRPTRVEVGELEDARFTEINQFRSENGLAVLTEKKLVFIGKHIYDGRLLKDRCSIEDVLEQIASAIGPGSVLQLTETGTALQNPNKRADKYGNMVNDRIIFECSTCRSLDTALVRYSDWRQEQAPKIKEPPDEGWPEFLSSGSPGYRRSFQSLEPLY
jgi:hypothetical protein